MPRPDRILMGPGPRNPCPGAVEALARPMPGRLDPGLLALLGETCERLRRAMLGRHGIETGGGPGGLAGRVWRVGCPGRAARRGNVVLLLGALAEVLGR